MSENPSGAEPHGALFPAPAPNWQLSPRAGAAEMTAKVAMAHSSLVASDLRNFIRIGPYPSQRRV